MTIFSYKSGGRVSRYLSDYRDLTVGDLNVSFNLEDWWEDIKQTQRIEEVTYGTVGDYGSYGIGSQAKGSNVGNDTQIATGGIFVVGDRGNFRFGGTATTFAKSMPITSINCFGTGANRYCVYSFESGAESETVGQHGTNTITQLGPRTIGSFTNVRGHSTSILKFIGAAEARSYVYDADIFDPWVEIDYGLITANAGSTEDNGLITGLDQVTTVDHGFIWRLGQERSFGFVKTVGEAQAKATNAWVGEGKITIFSKQKGANFYGYIVDGKVRCTGTADVTFSPAPKGRGILPLRGSCGEIWIPKSYPGSGLFSTFSGAAESVTWNPEEKQILFSFTSQGAYSNTDIASGSGNLFAIGGSSESTLVSESGRGLFKLTGTGKTHYVPAVEGTGRIPIFRGAAESLTWNPLEEQILFSVHGISTEKHTESYRGTGSIRKLSGAAESVRWAAQHTTGLYRISGDSIDTRRRHFIGSGSFKKFSGAAESLTVNPLEKKMLFSFVGERISEKHTESYVGSGRIRNLATLEAEKGSFDYVGSGVIKLFPRKPEIYQLSELANFTLDNYTLVNEFINLGYIQNYTDYTNLADGTLNWLIHETGHEKNTDAYNNSACEDGIELDYGFIINQSANLSCLAVSGTISTNTTASSGCTKVVPGTTLAIAPSATYTIPLSNTTPTSSEDYGLVSEPNATGARDYGWILDSLSKVCPFGTFDITGTAKTHYVENIISDGGLRIFGEGDTFWTPPYYGGGWTPITGIVDESFTPAPHIGEGSLFTMSGGAESISIGAVSGGLFRISGATYTIFSLQHFTSGGFRIFGEGSTPRTRPFIGSGSLKKFSCAAESATWNPLEKQMLFSFTGEHEVKFVANPPEEGTEIRLSGTTYPELLTFAEQPFGRIPISGEGATPRTRPYIGSGSFKKFSGAAESITFNPLEKQLLFSFIGSGTEAFVANPPEEGTNIRLRGDAVYKLDSSYVGSGTIPISGDASSKTTKPFVGSGSLKKFSGAAESITFNPLERQLLFSFTGVGSEHTVTKESGSGRLFTFSGATATSAAAFESTGLFKIDGFTDFARSREFIGSGSFKKFSGASESLTVNPDEKQLLFSFTGAGSQRTVAVPPEGTGNISIYPEASDIRFVPNWNSVGGVRINILSDYRFAPVWIGSGSLKKFSGAAESLTVNPLEKQLLFSFTGAGSESTVTKTTVEGGTLRLGNTSRIVWVPNNIGSGTTRLSGNATTHYVPDIEGDGRLYNFAGAADSFSVDITSIPTLFRVYGNGDIARSRPYTGSGSIRKLSGVAESLSFNPDEKQMLFSFYGFGGLTRTRSEIGQGTVKVSGEAGSRFSPVYIGSGTTRLSGEATVTRARDFIGFGSLRKLSGAAESLTCNPEEKQMLFSFTGEGATPRTSKLLSQGGVLTVRGTTGDPLLTFAEQPEVQVAISGDSYDIRTFGYEGSGRISNVSDADPSYVRAPYIGSGNVRISGIGLVQVQLFQPPHTQVWII